MAFELGEDMRASYRQALAPVTTPRDAALPTEDQREQNDADHAPRGVLWEEFNRAHRRKVPTQQQQ
jgi:hypothetical protein